MAEIAPGVRLTGPDRRGRVDGGRPPQASVAGQRLEQTVDVRGIEAAAGAAPARRRPGSEGSGTRSTFGRDFAASASRPWRVRLACLVRQSRSIAFVGARLGAPRKLSLPRQPSPPAARRAASSALARAASSAFRRASAFRPPWPWLLGLGPHAGFFLGLQSGASSASDAPPRLSALAPAAQRSSATSRRSRCFSSSAACIASTRACSISSARWVRNCASGSVSRCTDIIPGTPSAEKRTAGSEPTSTSSPGA